MERVICPLFDAILNEKYWAEVATYTIYILNRCLHTFLVYLTPEEKRSKHQPNLDNLRVFGCIGYRHQSQGKLKPRAG